MSVESLAVVLHHSRAKGTAKIVLIGIANHDGDGGAWPYVETLASYANVGVRAAQDAIASLVACPTPGPSGACGHKIKHLGEVRRYLQAGGPRDFRGHDTERPNRYDVLVECPEGCDRSTNHKPLKGWRRIDAATYIRVAAPVDNGVQNPAPGAESRTPPVQSAAPITVPEPSDKKGSRDLTVIGDRAACAICSLAAEACIARARTSGHTYAPKTRDPLALLERIRGQYDDEAQS